MFSTTKDVASVPSIKFLIFGESGAGKTFLASTLKEKTLIISAESGLLSLKDFDIPVWDISRNDKKEIIPKEKRFLELKKVYKWITTEKHDFKNIYLDSLTEVSECLCDFLKVKYPEKKDSFNFFNEYNTEMRGLVKDFRDLQGINVIFTCLEKRKVDEDTKQEKIVPQLVGSMSELINQYFDQVLYLFVDKEEKRRILTKTLATIKAKDRGGKLEKFEEPNLQNILEKLTK